jgi:hypothetical protein
MACDLIQAALCACDGIDFAVAPPCPACGGRVQGYDTKKKKFAVIREGDRERVITVTVKRFTCRSCGTLCYADEPFYPDTRIGSPVIDLCATLAGTRAFSRTATVLDMMGVIVDRSSCRKYGTKKLPAIPSFDVFGVQLPLSILSISSLSAKNCEGSGIKGAELLAACGFPSAYRAPPDAAGAVEERDDRDEEEEKEKRQPGQPQDRGGGKRAG